MSAAASERPGPNADAPLDPVASLFSSDRTLPAPVIAPEVNESEMTRWKSARDSLFGESVKDPPPAAGAPAANVRASSERRRDSSSTPNAPIVRALSVANVGQVSERTRVGATSGADAIDLAPPPSSRSGSRRVPEELSALPELGDAPTVGRGEGGRAKGRAPAPPAQPPTPLGARADATPSTKQRAEGGKKAGKADAKSEARAEAKSDAGKQRGRKKPPPTEQAEGKAPAPDTRPARRVRRGPKPLMLATLGIAVLIAGGAAAVFLGVVPAPFAEPAPTITRGMPAARALVAQPPAAAPAEAAPATEPTATAAAAPAKAAPAKAAPAKAAPAVAVVASAKPAAAPTQAAPEAATHGASEGAGPDALVALARKALTDEDAASAEALAKRALAKDANDHHAMEVLARALIDQDRGPEAVTFARRIVEKRKRRVPYRLLLGDALLMVGDAAAARKEWQAALEMEPGNREARQRLQ